jgi:short-subunit dehydrogenase
MYHFNMTSKPTVLITGVASSISQELAICFARDGYELILVDRNEEKLNEVGAYINKHFGVLVYMVRIDLWVPDGGENLYEKIKDLKIDAIVNYVESGFHSTIDSLNLCTHLILAQFQKRQPDKILNIVSTRHGLYFSDALRSELEGSPVKVTTLWPDPVKSASGSVRKAAEAGYRGLMNGKPTVVPGLRNKFAFFLLKFKPTR